jgi:hypothetical protein
MRIEHSEMLNEFFSFWFETRVDGVLKYETFLDLLSCEWRTYRPNENALLLTGTWKKSTPDDQIVGSISPAVESAIRTGAI